MKRRGAREQEGRARPADSPRPDRAKMVKLRGLLQLWEKQSVLRKRVNSTRA